MHACISQASAHSLHLLMTCRRKQTLHKSMNCFLGSPNTVQGEPTAFFKILIGQPAHASMVACSWPLCNGVP